MNDPFILLPPNLAGLADIAATGRQRFAMSCVELSINEDSYKAVATDGRRLALLEGEMTADPLDFPTLPELAAAPASAERAQIPADEWREAFRSVVKGQATRENPALGQVAVHLGEKQSLLTTADGAEHQIVRVANEEGRFPDYKAVLPAGTPEARVVLDPQLLLSLVKLACQVVRGEDCPRVVLELRAGNRPVVLRAASETQEFTGLLMPLAQQV